MLESSKIAEKLNKSMRYLIGAVLLLVVFIVIQNIKPHIKRHFAIKAKDAEISQQIEDRKKKIAIAQSYQQRFKTDRDFVEAIARQNNRVFPGELVFIFEED